MPTPAPNSRPADLPAGIGRFVPVRRLGKGAQGVVYLATDPDLGREVAIKTLARGTRDPGRLMNEARNVSRLQHPNIVTLFEMGMLHGGSPYLVYQYAPGVSLKQLLGTREPIPEHRTLKIFQLLLDAIGFAHKHGVIHRDLSPANILIEPDDTPHILDFGVSGMIGTASMSGDIVGTVNYMAPENLSKGEVGPHSDIFSLSAILHEMLTGQALFAANSTMAAMYKVLNEVVLPPSARNKTIRPELDVIVLRGLARNPSERFTDAAAMKQALDAYLNPEPKTAQGETSSGAIDFLLRRMSRKPDFPAISRHISEISQKTISLNNTQVSELSNVILKDYALTTKLLRLVNSANYGQYGGSITTVSRAVMILGFERVRMAALSIVLFEHLHSGSHAVELKNGACSAFLSGVIAQRIAAKLPGINSEEAFISAMFHRLGRHLTLYYFPEEFHEIERLTMGGQTKEVAACRQVLGVSFAELGMAVAKDWHLPTSIVRSMTPSPEGIVPPAKSRDDMLCRVAAFSNEVAEIAGQSDRNAIDQALRAVSQRYDSCLPSGKDKLKEIVSASLDQLRDYAEVLRVDVKSTRFYQNVAAHVAQPTEPDAVPADAGAEPAMAPGSSDSTAPPLEATDATDRRTVLMQGIAEITTTLLEDFELNHILVMILETIYRGMGFARVLFCIKDFKQNTIIARFGFGQQIQEIIPRFRFPVGSDDVLSMAARTGNEQFVPDVRSPQSGIRVPEWCLKLTAPGGLVVSPIVVNKAVIGLIYMDTVEPGIALTAEELRLLGMLRNQAALAIKQSRR